MIRPMGPHSHPQKMAEMTTEMGESPVLRPYSSGSMNLAYQWLRYEEKAGN